MGRAGPSHHSKASRPEATSGDAATREGGGVGGLGRSPPRLDRRRLPVHITPVTRAMVTTVADALPVPSGPLLRQLLNPQLTDRVLDLLGARGAAFDPLLHNTV